MRKTNEIRELLEQAFEQRDSAWVAAIIMTLHWVLDFEGAQNPLSTRETW